MTRKRNYESEFRFERLQFKSIWKIKEFCKLLDIMEIEFWVRTGNIVLNECFVCPDITEDQFYTLNDTPTERLIYGIIQGLELWYVPK